MSRADYEIVEKFLNRCEIEFEREAQQLQASADAEPTDHNKKAALGARWTMYHTREIKKKLAKWATS